MSWEEYLAKQRVSYQHKQRGREDRSFRLSWWPQMVRGILALVIGTISLIGLMGVDGVQPVNAAPLMQSGRPNPGTLAIVGASGAQLYATPGGESLQALTPGTVLTAVGRSADNLWAVVYNDANLSGWVEVSEVVLFGIEQLPVMVEGTIPVAAPTSAQPGASPQAPALLPTPTATPLATATPLPTSTPTPSPIPTATPSSTPSPTPQPTLPSAIPATASGPTGSENSLVAVVRGGGVALYDRPGGTETQQLPTGTALTVWGRSDDGQWLVVVASSGEAGWVQVAQVVVFNTEVLPVFDSVSGLPTAPDATSASIAGDAESVLTAAPLSTSSLNQEDAPVVAGATPSAPSVIELTGITASVTVTDSRLNVRSGPGTAFTIVERADPGDVFAVSGRNIDATWIELLLPDSEAGYGWVAADFVTLNQPILGIPVSERVSESAPLATAAPVIIAAAQNTSQNRSAPTDLSGRLVFQSTNGGIIYVYDLASGALTELTGGFDPAISPDGKTVAFTRMGGEQGLYLINIDGINERRIWSGGEGLRGPTWSPDGNWIAFVRLTGALQMP